MADKVVNDVRDIRRVVHFLNKSIARRVLIASLSVKEASGEVLYLLLCVGGQHAVIVTALIRFRKGFNLTQRERNAVRLSAFSMIGAALAGCVVRPDFSQCLNASIDMVSTDPARLWPLPSENAAQ